MTRQVLYRMLVACLVLVVASLWPAQVQGQQPAATAEQLAARISTTPVMVLDQSAETASFSQAIFPATDDAATTVRQNPLIGQVTVSAADYEAGKTEALLKASGVFTDRQVGQMLVVSAKKWKKAELSIGGGKFMFNMTATREVVSATGERSTVTETAGLGAGSKGELATLLGKLSGPDTPLSLSTVVADGEVVTTLGLSAWLTRREEHKTFTLKPDFQKRYPASWRFSLYGGEGGGILVEVVRDLTKDETAEAFNKQVRRTGQPWGFTAGYDVGGGDRPLYLGTTWSPAGRFGLTAGYVLGGGEDGHFAFGVSFDVGDLIDDVTTAVGGEEQEGEPTETGGGGNE